MDCFTDILAYTAFLLKGRETVSFDQAKADLDRLISQSESRLHDHSREDYDLARFAVFAWVDEAVLGSNWEGKTEWQKKPLQRRFYQTADAGELFFQRLNTIGPHQGGVREVYYLCLAMGFTGQYCNQGDEMLIEQLKASNLKLITGSSVDLPSLESMTLFPEAYAGGTGTDNLKKRSSLNWVSLTSVLLPPGLMGILFVIFKFILNNLGDTIISRIP